jgi:UrcA family protein
MTNNETIRRVAFAAVAIATSTLSLTAVAGPAFAGGVKVSYADINAGTAAGRATLDARLRLAAGQVCDTGASGLREQLASRRCAKETYQSARLQMADRASGPVMAATSSPADQS